MERICRGLQPLADITCIGSTVRCGPDVTWGLDRLSTEGLLVRVQPREIRTSGPLVVLTGRADERGVVPVVRRHVDDLVTLPDEQIFEAVVWIMSHLKVVPEGAAAAPVAALLQGLITAALGTKVVCVLSGGNVNLDQLRGLKWN